MTDEESVLAANAAYYDAFQKSDYPALAALWADDGVSCIHPGWAILDGREEVLQSYRLILRNPDQEPVISRQARVYLTGDTARVLCIELVGGGSLAATNLFIRTGATWRMIHHHASPIAQRMTQAESSRRLN